MPFGPVTAGHLLNGTPMDLLINHMPLGAGLVAMLLAAWLMVRRLRRSSLTAFALFESVILPAVMIVLVAAAYYWSGPVLAHPIEVTNSDIRMLAAFTMLGIILAIIISLPLLLIVFALGLSGLPWMTIAQSAFTLVLGAMLGNLVGYAYAILRRAGSRT